jgi:ATP-dependent RNA helicase RhlE
MEHPSQGHTGTFDGLGIAPNLRAILDKLRFTTPTPIQAKAIPVGIDGKDIIGIAQTGTGKTLAFSIPILQRLSALRGQALILLPTRELALQVEETLVKFAPHLKMRSVVLIGGASMEPQVSALRSHPDIIVGTPGRIIDHLTRRSLTLQHVKVLVLDEADRMLDMGFAPQINRILTHVPKDRQTMLFSATMPDDIVRIANQHMKTPLRVEIARAGTTAERVTQELFIVSRDKKTQLLEKVLGDYRGSVLVFTRTKHGARKLARLVRSMQISSAEIHSDRSLSQRKAALAAFKAGTVRVLVATDIAARGIDVQGIELVLNYDIPEHAEDYVHRIGRTGRAGKTGHAITFASPDQHHEVRDIERLIRAALSISQVPDLPPPRLGVLHHGTSEDAPRPYRRQFGSSSGRAHTSQGRRSSYGRPRTPHRGPSTRPHAPRRNPSFHPEQFQGGR